MCPLLRTSGVIHAGLAIAQWLRIYQTREGTMKTANPIKHRSAPAKALASAAYRQRIVRDRTKYTRKGRKPRGDE